MRTEPLRLSCRLELLPGRSVLARLKNAKRFGFDAVAIPGRHLKTFLPGLRACAGEAPVPFSALSLGFEGSLLSPSPRIRAKCRDSLRALFDLCAELEVPNLNMPPVLIQDNPERLEDENEQDRLLCEQLPALADEADRCGVQLLLEPVNRYESEYLNTLDHAVRLCLAMAHPNVRITADVFHMQIEEANSSKALLTAGAWIGYVHVADNTRVEPGVGSLRFRDIFTALDRMKYSGFVEIESRKLSGPPEDVLPASARFLHACVAKCCRVRRAR